jgi:thiol-disulfide isomerase/thioredoxin
MSNLKFKYFYSPGCAACNQMKPFISRFKKELNIEMINNDEDQILSESYKVDWLPTLVMEHEGNTWKFESPKAIEEFLTKASNGSL